MSFSKRKIVLFTYVSKETILTLNKITEIAGDKIHEQRKSSTFLLVKVKGL